MGKPLSPETLRIRNSIIRLLRWTTWKCGKVERHIVKFLMRRYPQGATFPELLDSFLKAYGPTKGKLAHKIWNKGMRFSQKYGPTKGRFVYEVVEALRRLESRYIIKVDSSHKKKVGGENKDGRT